MERKLTDAFAKRLRQLRASARLDGGKKLSKMKLAPAIGVHLQTVSQWEGGEYMPRMHHLMALCAFFKVELGELLLPPPRKERP